MRVAHVLTSPMSLLFLRGQLDFLTREGIDVHVCVAPGASPVPLPSTITRHDIPMRREIAPVADVHALSTLIARFHRLRPDIVHCQTPKAGLLGVLAGAATRVPVRLYHVRGLRYHGETGARRRLLRIMEGQACRWATAVQSHGPSLTQAMLDDGLVRADKVFQVEHGSNGVDTTHFSEACVSVAERQALRARHGIAPSAPVALFVGRLHRDKGIRELLAAWKTIRAAHVDARLVLAGPVELGDVDQRTVEAAVASGVIVAGAVEDPRAWYAVSTVVLLPTYREGMPNVLLEAAAMSRPVVATRATGCIDIVVPGRTGMLVPIGDADALAAAWGAYVADSQLAEQHGRQARRHVSDVYNPERIWRAQLAAYQRLRASVH